MYSRALASSLLMAQAVSAMPTTRQMGGMCGKAIYMLGNEEDNAVVAVPIGDNGMLSGGTCTSTGGSGANSISAMTGEAAVPDALVSQSALTVAGNNLFAVNAGSNSVTMFSINQQDPTQLTMVGQPVQVPGEFPNTVAASEKNNMVCVGMTGAQSGISCAPFSEQGIGQMDGLRNIALDQSTPPTGPPNTMSQVFFSDDESTMFTTVKGNPDTGKPPILGAFPVTEACEGAASSVSMEGTMSSPNGTMVLFGSFAIPNSNNIFATDAGFGATVMSVNPQTNAATLQGMQAIQGQTATCWSTMSPATNSAWTTDAGTNNLVEMSLEDASILSMNTLPDNGNPPGLFDLMPAGDYLYILNTGDGSASPAVRVFDTAAKQQVQNFEMQDLGVTANVMGMAVLM